MKKRIIFTAFASIFLLILFTSFISATNYFNPQLSNYQYPKHLSSQSYYQSSNNYNLYTIPKTRYHTSNLNKNNLNPYKYKYYNSFFKPKPVYASFHNDNPWRFWW